MKTFVVELVEQFIWTVNRTSNMANEKVEQAELAQSLRSYAFFGTVLSTMALLIAVVSVPMAYNYVQYYHTMMLEEVDFCKLRSANVWKEVVRTEVRNSTKPSIISNYGYYIN